MASVMPLVGALVGARPPASAELKAERKPRQGAEWSPKYIKRDSRITSLSPTNRSRGVAAAEHPDPSLRLRTGRALARAGSRCGDEPLLRLLHDEDPGIRMQALVAVLRFRQTPEIVRRVRRLASQDPVEAVPGQARRAIKRLTR